MGEELSECVCSGDCAWGWEEDMKKERCGSSVFPPRGVLRYYGHVLIQRENRFGILSFVFNSGVPELAQCHTRICL